MVLARFLDVTSRRMARCCLQHLTAEADMYFEHDSESAVSAIEPLESSLLFSTSTCRGGK